LNVSDISPVLDELKSVLPATTFPLVCEAIKALHEGLKPEQHPSLVTLMRNTSELIWNDMKPLGLLLLLKTAAFESVTSGDLAQDWLEAARMEAGVVEEARASVEIAFLRLIALPFLREAARLLPRVKRVFSHAGERLQDVDDFL
jgi:hypothetical protein